MSRRVSVGYVPRLGIGGRDHDDDIAAAIVVMGRTQHTNDIIPRVEAEVEKLNTDGSLPPGVKVVPYYDRSSLVGVTTHTVLHNLIFGCLLVFLIQWIFLGDLRSAIIVSANIPFALFFAIIILVLQGQDANLLSLGAVDFGIIVDSAVIMMENIYRNFQSSRSIDKLFFSVSGKVIGAPIRRRRMSMPPEPELDGATTRHFCQRAAGRQGCVFYGGDHSHRVRAAVHDAGRRRPDLRADGPHLWLCVGRCAARHLHGDAGSGGAVASQAYRGDRNYHRSRAAAELHAGASLGAGNLRIAVIVGCVFLASSVAAASRLGSEFLPALEEGNFWIRAAMPSTMSLDAGTAATAQDARNPAATSGSHHRGVAAWPPRQRQRCLAVLQCRVVRPAQAVRRMAGRTYQGKADGTVAEGIQRGIARHRVQLLPIYPGQCRGSPVGRQGRQFGQDCRAESGDTGVAGNPGDGRDGQGPGRRRSRYFHLLGQPNLNIKIDREKAARYGLNTGDVNTVVQAALGGTKATTVLEGDRQFALAVRLDPKYRSSIDAIRTVKVAYQTPSGINGYVPLSELADITLDTGASFIYRERSQRFIPIKFSVRGRDLGSTVEEAQQRVTKAVKLPNGYRIIWAGEFEDLQNAKQRLLIVVPITLLLILILLYGLFNSLRDSLLAVAGIPFAIGGGLIALYLAGLDFSVSAAIGFISLFGVAVMDGILNITYFRELRAQGMDIAEAVFHGAEQRMRPMLMTALSAGVGLLPAAISHGIGSQVQRPLATVVVGGMFIGPLLLLVVAPALRKIFLSRDRPIANDSEDVAAAESRQES